MSLSSVDGVERSVHKTNRWLNELSELAGWDSKQKAYLATRATLHALRDRLTVDETAQLGAQLPMLVRGIYYEGWDPSHKPERLRHKDEFLARIEQQFRSDDLIAPEQVACAVFIVLANRVTAGEIEDVKQILPAEIRELWP